MAILREEDLLRLGVRSGHARRILLRLPDFLAAAAAAAAAAATINTTKSAHNSVSGSRSEDHCEEVSPSMPMGPISAPDSE